MSRYAVSGALALLVTFVLFWAMQALITVGYELLEGGEPLSVEFVRLRRDTTPEAKERELPRKKPPEQPPPPPEMNVAKVEPKGVVGEIVPMMDSDLELSESTSLGTGGSDRDAVPIVRVDPQYPMRAAQLGIEGWVELEFTISTAGSVKDVRVVKAKPNNVFDKAAVTALRKWKYNPKVMNGTPVEQAGVRTVLRFRMN